MRRTPRYNKLYVIGRADLAPGHQATQASHAAFQFAVEHPQETRRWYPGNLILLAVEDEADLLDFTVRARQRRLPSSLVYEPDFDEYTALAVAPGKRIEKMTSDLPLTLKAVDLDPPRFPYELPIVANHNIPGREVALIRLD